MKHIDVLGCVANPALNTLTLNRSVILFFRIQENRQQIRRNLYTINPVLAQMLEMWQTTYIHKHFISTELLAKHEGSFDLAEFTVR